MKVFRKTLTQHLTRTVVEQRYSTKCSILLT